MLINIYLIITSIPIITVGASVIQHMMLRAAVNPEGNLTNYSYIVQKNFVQSAIWIPMAAAGALLGYSWISLQIPPASAFQILAAVPVAALLVGLPRSRAF